MTRKTHRPCRKRLRARLPLSHATVLFGFPLQVSDRLRGLSLSTPPLSERNLNKRLCGAQADEICPHIEWLEEHQKRQQKHILLHDHDSRDQFPGVTASRTQRFQLCDQAASQVLDGSAYPPGWCRISSHDGKRSHLFQAQT